MVHSGGTASSCQAKRVQKEVTFGFDPSEGLQRTLCTARGTVLSSMSDRLSHMNSHKCCRFSAVDPMSPEWIQLSIHQVC